MGLTAAVPLWACPLSDTSLMRRTRKTVVSTLFGMDTSRKRTGSGVRSATVVFTLGKAFNHDNKNLCSFLGQDGEHRTERRKVP